MADGGGPTLIAAIAFGRAIGARNRLPWRLPEDLRRFKALTTGHAVVMGRKTWDSLGKPLPGRTNVVVTRHGLPSAPPGVHVAPSLPEALRFAGELGRRVFVAGGAQVYEAALADAAEIDATLVYLEVPEADAFFPRLDAAWHVAGRQDAGPSAEGGTRFSFATFRRGPPDGCALCRVREGRAPDGDSPWDQGYARALRDLAGAGAGAGPAAAGGQGARPR